MKKTLLKTSSEYRRTLFLITALFTLSFTVIVSLVIGAAETIDADETRQVREVVSQSLLAERAQLLNQLRDYAVWDDAYRQWHLQPQPDPQWLASNLGKSLYANLNIHWVFVRDESGQLLFSAYKGEEQQKPADSLSAIPDALSTPDMATRLSLINDELWLLASHPLLAENDNFESIATRRSLVFARPLATSLGQQIRLHNKSTAQIHFRKEPPTGVPVIPVKDLQGNPFVYLDWQPDKPGTQLLRHLLPLVILLLALLAIGTLLLLKRLVRQGRRSLKEIQELADTRQALATQQVSVQGLRQRFQEQADQTAFLNAVITESQKLVKADLTAIWLLDDSKQRITCEASDRTLTGQQLPVDVIASCLKDLQKNPVITLDIPSKSHGHLPAAMLTGTSLPNGDTIRSIAVTAIYMGGQLRGVLSLGHRKQIKWSDAEKSACSALAGVIAQFAEAFQRRVAEADFYQQKNFDEVTSLPRLAYVHQTRAEQFRTGSGTLAVLRIQGLHIINELHGLEAGNLAFRELVLFIQHQLAQQLAETPLFETQLIRLPANRLALFFTANRHQAQSVTEQLITLCAAKNWLIKRKNYALQLQAGLACYPDDGTEIEVLLHRAKLALQHVRSSPELSYAFYSNAVHMGLKQRAKILLELKQALDEEQFQLYLQPQFNAQGQIRGAEALIRWQHPTQGLLSPAHFIDLMEETGMIVPLGRWILQTACQLLDQLPITLSVNLSVVQLKQENFISELTVLLDQHSFPPDQLVLEIVESLMLDQQLKEKLAQIRQQGVQIALDDFGTGFSSLSYLQELQLDELKVDQSFMKPLESQDDAPLVRTIIAMAHTLGMRVVVEGIETQQQLNFVHEQKAELTQGYLLARPEPVSQFLARLHTQNSQAPKEKSHTSRPCQTPKKS